jgi:hypothetical protein
VAERRERGGEVPCLQRMLIELRLLDGKEQRGRRQRGVAVGRGIWRIRPKAGKVLHDSDQKRALEPMALMAYVGA